MNMKKNYYLVIKKITESYIILLVVYKADNKAQSYH